MLERVSPSAECAAHTILSRFEGPIRSQRYLGASFWKHGRANIDTPVWWPAYLDGIRSRTPAISSTSIPTLVAIPAVKATPQTRNRRHGHLTGRSFGLSSKPQVQSGQAVASESTEGFTHGSVARKHTVEETIQATREQPGHSPSQGSRHHPTGVEDGKDAKFPEAWNRFVNSGLRPAEAQDILRLLATSGSETDLRRALHAFDLIPRSERTSMHYELAVDSSIHLNRYSVAIRTIKEAVSRQIDYGTFFKFLSVCVTKSLWITAAELWKEVGHQNNSSFEPVASESAFKQNFAGKHISHFDNIPDFPSKLVNLVTRLEENDPILANQKPTLLDLCKQLALVVVENEKSMKTISGQGLMAIFALQQQIGFDQRLHLAALATINQMSDKGAKSQLAILIYQNFKLAYPKVLIPKWVIGTMIGICASAKQPAIAYRALLDDYKNMYGTIDNGIYLQVLRACATQGEVDDVAIVFSDFCKHGGPKRADDVTPLIRVHAVTGNVVMAQKQFDSIEPRFGFKPSVRNWNALLLAYSRSNQHESAYKKFQEMQSHVQPDSHSWSILVAVAAKRGDTTQAREVVRLARENGIVPPLAMIGAVVDSHLFNDEPEEAWPLVIDATDTALKTTESPVRLWNSMLRYFAFKSDSESIINTQAQMAKYKVKPDAMTYAALMTALVNRGRTLDAVEILRTLHFSQVLTANEFHYSILIHGFVMEKQRNLAMVIYNEMVQRFPRVTPSVKLAMVYLEALRDEEKAKTEYLAGREQRKPDFSSTLTKIKEVMADTKNSDLASSLPNPGFGRKSVRNDLDDTYLNSLLTFLQRNDAHHSAKQAMKMIRDNTKSLTSENSGPSPSWSSSLDRLSLELDAFKSLKDWIGVSNTWKQIVDLVLKVATPQVAASHQVSKSEYESQKLHNIETTGNKGSRFSGIIFQPFNASEAESESQTIIPAYRYALSRALSSYLDALDKQQKYAEMLDTIQNLRERGFQLSSKNWNGLIQSLCRSQDPDYQSLAFELFDKHLLPNAPAWDIIRRGKWVHPSEQRPRYYWDKITKKQDERKNRKALEKLDPGLMMPSYFTMVHLAVVWLKVTQSALQGDKSMENRLKFRNPGTIKLVQATPYLSDRVQGILLRGRRVIGDPVKQPRQAQEQSAFAGVQGSQLLIDQISPDTLQELGSQPKLNNNQLTKDNLAQAAKISGEVVTSKIVDPTTKQLESSIDRDRRVLKQRRSAITKLRELNEQLQDDARNRPSLVETPVRGSAPLGPVSLSPNLGSTQALKGYKSRNEHLATESAAHLQLSSGIDDMQRIIGRVGKQHLDHTVASSPLGKRHLIRTNLLTQRLGTRLYPSSGRYRLTAKPRQKLKIPRVRRSEVFASERQTESEDNFQPRELITPRHLDWHRRLRGINKQRLLIKVYTTRYAAKQLQASSTSVPSKKLRDQIFAYKRFVTLAKQRLLAAESRFRDASGVSPPLPSTRKRRSRGRDLIGAK